MTRSSTSSWLPLGSALAIDWKHLGRPAAARGATAWVTALDGESVLLRAWGEETTSYFDFVLLNDERVAGAIVVSCSRSDGNRLRLKIDVEVEDHLAYTDVAEFRENARTLMLSQADRTFEAKRGAIDQSRAPAIPTQAAELFEIAPDSALMTRCAEWILEIVAACRDGVRGHETPREIALEADTPAPASADPKNGKAEPKKDAQQRARTEHAVRPNAARETLDVQPPRRNSPSGEISRERSVPEAAATPAPREARENRENRDGREARDGREGREPKENRDARDSREMREVREPKENRDAREPREGREPKENRADRESRESREAREPRERAAGSGPTSGSLGPKLLCSTNTGESFEISGDETFIGRSKQCGIVLKSQRVSRKHACVTREADGYYINDLGAANGIWVGSEKIDRERIESGDEFIIGDVVLSFTVA